MSALKILLVSKRSRGGTSVVPIIET